MKTKLIYTIVWLLLIAAFTSSAQTEWAPIGAKWYNTYQSGDIPGLVEYFTYESVKDTVVDGKDCRKLEIYYFAKDSEPVYWGMELLHQDGEKIYTYHSSDFHILYDFTLTVGDTLESFILNSLYPSSLNPDNLPRRAFYQVSETGDTLIDGVTLKFQKLESIYLPELSDDYSFWIGGKVIERVGSLAMLLGEIDPRVEMPPWWGSLRCYVDNEISFKINPVMVCDTVFNYNAIPVPNNNIKVNLYPNPSSDEIILELQKSYNFVIDIFDSMGRNWYSKDYRHSDGCTIPISRFSSGIYYFRVRIENEKPFTLLFTKKE